MLLSKRNTLIRVITFSVLVFVVPAFLGAKIHYYNEEEYQDLSKDAVKKYWVELENELTNLQAREASATEQQIKNEKKIARLEDKLSTTETDYDALYTKIIDNLGGINNSEIVAFQQKLEEMKSQLNYYEQMPNSELDQNFAEIRKFIKEFENMQQQKIAKVPQLAYEFQELDPRIKNLNEAVPQYYEDKHTVVKGEYLSKISGYKHIYNDPSKWGIIYRANRDKIKDPDLIYPDQVFAIPRGLPTTWKVYKGECLWTISSYPEIYDDPFKWPQIYRANNDKIEDPDLIYPNQILRIPRN